MFDIKSSLNVTRNCKVSKCCLIKFYTTYFLKSDRAYNHAQHIIPPKHGETCSVYLHGENYRDLLLFPYLFVQAASLQRNSRLAMRDYR